jgi:aspartate/tyrosine/aromatic aminotransferase
VIADMAEQQGFMPFIDIAYQGLGDGLEEDAAGLRLLAARLPEMIVAASCSKNMGLYRERTGLRCSCVRMRRAPTPCSARPRWRRGACTPCRRRTARCSRAGAQ